MFDGYDLASQLRRHVEGHQVLTGRAEQVVEAVQAAGLVLVPAADDPQRATVTLPEPDGDAPPYPAQRSDFGLFWQFETAATLAGEAILLDSGALEVNGWEYADTRLDALERDALRLLAAVRAHRRMAATKEES